MQDKKKNSASAAKRKKMQAYKVVARAPGGKQAVGKKRPPRKKPIQKRGNTYNKKNDWWAAPVAAVMICMLATMGFLATNAVSQYAVFREMRAAVERQTFYPGIFIDGMDLSGTTLQAAMERWAEDDRVQRQRYEVTLHLDSQQWVLGPDDMGFSNDYRQVLASAWAVGRYGSLEDRYFATKKNADGKIREFSIRRTAEKKVLQSKTDAIADELSVGAVNAKIKSFDPQTLSFLYTEAKSGLAVDKAKLLNSVVQAINDNKHDVQIVRDAVQPNKTPAELALVYGEIASAITNASSSSKNRLTNIDLSCKAMDGLMIKPGETFSFNGVVGKRTSEKGYKSAGAIENGIMTNQLGGGICQVSTTLFNAVAKADMEIVERSPHSRPSTYVDLGKDAAVDWPNQDFKFKNTSSNPIYISARLNDQKRVVIGLYGEKLKDGMSITIQSKKTATIKPGAERYIKDKNLAKGETVVVEAARNGYKAETYKVYLDQDGQEIRREFLCNSSYASSGTVIKIGQ